MIKGIESDDVVLYLFIWKKKHIFIIVNFGKKRYNSGIVSEMQYSGLTLYERILRPEQLLT